MGSLLGTLNSSKNGMNASQTGIQTVSHNINNLKTVGYTRQRVDQVASRANSVIGFNNSVGQGQIGTGVTVTNVTRIRNTFYDFQFRSESHKYGNISVKYEYYQNMEKTFNEPSTNSISAKLNEFFKRWNELSKNPNDVGVKNIVVENSKYLANNINDAYKKLNNLQENLDKQKIEIENDINQKIVAYKELSNDIKVMEATGRTPNDLLDEKDKILDDLSFKIDVNNPAVKEVLEKGEKINFSKADSIKNPSGELGAIDTINTEIEKYKNNLKEMAGAIAKSVNSAINEKNIAEQDLYVFDPSSDDIIKVNEKIDENPDKLQVTPDVAISVYNLRNEKVSIGEKQKEISISNYYNSTIKNLGQASQNAIREENNMRKLITNIDKSRMSVSGVSLDEEMLDLVELQHAYNANAKVISTIDSLLDAIINGLIR